MIYQKKCCFVVIEEKTHQHSSQTIVFFFKEVVLFFLVMYHCAQIKKWEIWLDLKYTLGEYFSVTQISDSRNLSFNVYGNIT